MSKYDSKISLNDNSSHGKIIKTINKNDFVLEFGCATGITSRHLKEKLSCRVWGVEIDADALAKAEPYLEKAICCDIEKYEWEKELDGLEFDKILFADVLEHLRNPEEAVTRAKAFLKEGGKMIFSIPNIGHADVIAKLIEGRFDYSETGLLDDTHIHFFGKNNLKEFCDRAGLFLAKISAVIVPISQTEQKFPVKEDVISFLESKDGHNVYQFVCEAYDKGYAEKNGVKFEDFAKDTVISYMQIYFDFGDGFSEQNVRFVETRGNRILIREKMPHGVKRLRVDIKEKGAFFVKSPAFVIDSEIIDRYQTVNAYKLNDGFIIHDDSQFIFDINNCSDFSLDTFIYPIIIDGTTPEAIFGAIKANEETLASKVAEVKNDNEELEKNIAFLEEKSELAQNYISDLNEQKKLANERIEFLGEAKRLADEQITSLEKEKLAKEEQILLLNEEKRIAEEKITTLGEEKRLADENIAVLTEENKKQIENISVLNKENEDLKDNIIVLREENKLISEGFAKITESVEKSDREKKLLGDFIDTLKSEKTYLEEKLSESNEAIDKLESENEDFKKEIAELNENIYELKEERGTLNSMRRAVELKKGSLQSENERLLSKLSEMEERWIATEQKRLATEGELSEFREHYRGALEQINEYEKLTQTLQYQYACIKNSFFWKLTKPFRLITDLIKKIPVLKTFIKGVKCLKENGFKYTLRKIGGKFRHNKVAKCTAPTPEVLEEQKQEQFEKNIKFSILVPLYNTPADLLGEMIESVVNQSYSNWELCLADGSDEAHAYVEAVVKTYIDKDARIKYARLEKNLGISENTNFCARMASGDFIALFDHDDLLSPDALYENVKAICETNADVLYSDEDHLSLSGMHVNPFYKPDYSPDLLRSQMYICHFLVINRELFERIGGFNSAYDGSQDYDLMLRLSEQTERICHIPKILYTWRECEGSTAANADAKPYAHTAGKNALDAHLKRVFGDGAYADDSDYTFVFDARYDTMKNNPKVSIIIPMKDKWELTDACVKSILEKSTYSNYEIIILDNRSVEAKTFTWFNEIVKRDERISVYLADMEFNWSKINNFGITKASGDVYIFLNNDIEIITNDWIERLCENALREDIGVVGPLLLYEDNTIQHAGVLVGFGGWADHIFKGMPPVHFGAPYVSPMVSRNVLAVTGACLAVSKNTIDEIGGFDESFVICGSDIELGIRAYERGYNNKYLATVKLYHYESKSRDASNIPEIDFKRSYEVYTPYRENIDPYFNINLDINSAVPREKVGNSSMMNFKNFLKRCPLTAPVVKAIKRSLMPPAEYNIPEILGLGARKDGCDNGKLRINLLTPSVDTKHVFGGISTAMKMFESLRKELGCEARMITTDAPVIKESSVAPEGYEIVSSQDDSELPLQLVAFSDRYAKSIPVRKNDIFVATGWWTAYTIKDVIKWQSEEYGNAPLPLIYMIQDYEPGFYPWSSRYMMADSTYKMSSPIYAIINSKELHEFFNNNGYKFEKAWSFAPVLNDKIAEFLPSDDNSIPKKKQILVYGRPTTERNAFALLMAGLKLWREQFEGASEWKVLSAGESHDDVDLGAEVFVHSCGKLTLEEYANTMIDTYAGVSLMVSPHPSYPPLEMSTFGIKTITNTYANKNMSSFNKNIVSLDSCSASDIADALTEICRNYNGKGYTCSRTEYAKGGKPFGDCVEKLAESIKNYFDTTLPL